MKNRLQYLYLIVILFIFVVFNNVEVLAKGNEIDSLLKVLKSLPAGKANDTTRIKLRYEIGERSSNFRIGFWDSLSLDAKNIGLKSVESLALNNVGFLYHHQGDIPKALQYFSKSLKIQEETGHKIGIANSLNNIGFIYQNQGDIQNALINFEKSLKIQKEISDKPGIANSLNNIGIIYNRKGDIPKALNYFSKSLKIQEEIGDKKGIGNSLNNIGFINYNRGDILVALDFYSRSLRVRREIDDKSGIANSLNNIGSAYVKLAISSGSIADKQKNIRLALSYSDSSLALSKELGYPEPIRNAEYTHSIIDSARGNYAGSLEHYKQYIVYRDSITNEQTSKASTKNQLKYEYEKKEAIIQEQQEKERAVAEEKNRFQQIVIISVVGGLLLVIAFAFFVFRSLKLTRMQKIVIEEKQKDILDSIRYAKRIQTSLLPTEKYIEKNLNRLKATNNE